LLGPRAVARARPRRSLRGARHRHDARAVARARCCASGGSGSVRHRRAAALLRSASCCSRLLRDPWLSERATALHGAATCCSTCGLLLGGARHRRAALLGSACASGRSGSARHRRAIARVGELLLGTRAVLAPGRGGGSWDRELLLSTRLLLALANCCSVRGCCSRPAAAVAPGSAASAGRGVARVRELLLAPGRGGGSGERFRVARGNTPRPAGRAVVGDAAHGADGRRTIHTPERSPSTTA